MLHRPARFLIQGPIRSPPLSRLSKDFYRLSFFDSLKPMKAKHTKPLQAIFAKPTPATLEWARIETLFIALGCQRDRRAGLSCTF